MFWGGLSPQNLLNLDLVLSMCVYDVLKVWYDDIFDRIMIQLFASTGDLVGYVLAWYSLLPIFILVGFGTLIVFRRDLHTVSNIFFVWLCHTHRYTHTQTHTCTHACTQTHTDTLTHRQTQDTHTHHTHTHTHTHCLFTLTKWQTYTVNIGSQKVVSLYMYFIIVICYKMLYVGRIPGNYSWIFVINVFEKSWTDCCRY